MNRRPGGSPTVDPQALLARGFRALSRGEINEASACCKLVLGRQPDNARAHFLVGLVALAGGDRRTATSAFAAVTRHEPGHGAAWAHLARLLAEGGQINRADLALAKAVQFASGDIPAVHDVIGTTCSLLGEHRDAARWYRRAVDAQPENPAFLVNYANSLVYLGETGPARDYLGRAIAAGPGSAQAHWLLAGLEKATDHRHVDIMRGLLEGRRLPPQAQAFIHYGIGKELEDLGEWEAAFEAFSAGARARRSTLDYDENQEQAWFDSLKRCYTADWLARRPGGCDDPSPIFVVGQPRTGTTLVERIITSHTRVHSAGELQQFGNCIRRMSDYDHRERFSPALFEGARDIDPQLLGRDYILRTTKLRGELPRFVDKLPYNYLFLPHILSALPRAKIIHLVRDPRDVCFSVFKQLFADAYPHSYHLEEMARHFVRYHRLMGIWRERFPGRFLDVRYEAVVSDLPGNARRLIDYLELPWEDACVDFHRQETAVTTASAVQVREPAHTRSVGRWRRYARQLQPAIDILESAGLLDTLA